MNKIKIFALVMAIWLGSLKITLAQEASQAAQPTSDTTTTSLKERIERVISQKKSKVKGISDQPITDKQGFMGELKRISAESLTIATSKGTRIIPINDQVNFLKSQQNIEIKDLVVGNWLVIMGVIQDDTFAPVRILVSTKSLRPKNYVVKLGEIKQLSRTQLDILPRLEQETVSITLHKNSQYQDINGQTISLSDISNNLQALAIYYQEDNELTLKTLRLLSVIDEDSSTDE